jgi:hypothetical protein
MPSQGLVISRAHYRNRFIAVTAAFLSFLSALPVCGDDLLDNLRLMGKDAAQGYMAPVTSSFGAALNSGMFYRPPDKERIGLSFDFGVVTMGGLYTGAPRHFTTAGVFNFDQVQAAFIIDSAFAAFSQDPRIAALAPDQRQAIRDSLVRAISGPDLKVTARGPTAIGPKHDSLHIQFEGQTLTVAVPATGVSGAFDTTITVAPRDIVLPASGALEAFPFSPVIAPRVSIGTLWGTMGTFRWLPPIRLTDDIGKLSIFGFDIDHNLAYWLGPASPFDLTLQLSWDWLQIENTLNSQAFSGGLVGSTTFGSKMLGVIPFFGLYLDKSWIDADYTYSLDLPVGKVERTVKFSQDGDNDAHASLGAAFMFFHVNLSGEYTFSNYNTFSVSLMVML